MTGFVELPEETLVHILRRASPEDVQICRQVCRFLRTLIDSSAELQYLIELYTLGYVPPAHSRLDLTYPEKLELLQKHKSHWNSIHTISHKRYPLLTSDTGYTSTYDFYGGVYARGSTSNSLNGATRRLDLYQLPSVNKGTEYKQWTHLDLGVDTRDFVMEPDFDLLVLLELGHQTRIPRAERGTPNVIQHFNVHLRSLETCAPHPEAAKPIIRHSLCSFERTSWSFYFQVVGRYLAVLFLIGVDQQEESQTCQLRVWDWTTGNPVTYVDVVGAESRGFAFLSDNLIAIPRHATSIPNLESTQEKALGTVNIYTFEPPAGTSLVLPARHIASLQLPLSPENSASTTRLSCRSDPAPSPSTQAAVWDRRRPRLFELAPTNRVLCLHATVTLLSRAGFIEGYEGTLYIPFENLLNTVADLRDRSQPVNIEWGSWGNGTSWLNTSDMRTNNECYVFGQRTVSTTTFAQDEDEDSSPRAHSFVVLDFDPVRLSKRHNSDLFDPASGNISHFDIEDNLLWEAFLGKNVECKANAPLSVETARIRTRLSSEYYVMIDDEHIVLVLSRLGVESALLVYSL